MCDCMSLNLRTTVTLALFRSLGQTQCLCNYSDYALWFNRFEKKSIPMLKIWTTCSVCVLRNLNAKVSQRLLKCRRLLYVPNNSFGDNAIDNPRYLACIQLKLLLLLFVGMSFSSGCLRRDVLFYCDTPWTLHIAILSFPDRKN